MTLVFKEDTHICAHQVLHTIKRIEQWTNANSLTRGTASIKINAISCILSMIVVGIVKTEEPALKGIEYHAEMVPIVNGNPAISYTHHKKTY